VEESASKVMPYRLDIPDLAQGVAASQVVVEEAGAPVMLALRLKVVNNAIAEVETQVTRSQKEGAINCQRPTTNDQPLPIPNSQ
jgi:hypothetical protein